MFILKTNDVGIAMFTKVKKVKSYIDLWHKWFDQINFPKLQEMQLKQIVFGLPKFNGKKGQLCEACQIGKHHLLPFPNDKIGVVTSST